MANHLVNHFHVPGNEEESKEQIAYEKQILLQHYPEQAGQGSVPPQPATGQTPMVHLEQSHDRGISHTNNVGSGGSTIRGHLKSFVKEVKATSQSAVRFVSLESRITKELDDPACFPEIARKAFVRTGLDLCPEEKTYRAARRLSVRDHFARYMCVDSAQVHPDDMPIVSFGGSGGGYRAMLAFLGYSLAMKQAGLWGLLTYVAGVSGSCE